MTPDLARPTDRVDLDMLERAWKGDNSAPVIFKLIKELRAARARLAALEQPGVTEGKVEQAAQAIFDAANISLASLLGYVSWDKCSHDDKERYRAMARCAARALVPAPIAQGGETADDVRKRVEGALRLAVDCINAGKPISVIEVVQFALQPPGAA